MIETVTTYAARRQLKIGTEYRNPPLRGEEITPENLVPEACTWLLVDSLLHHGQIVQVEVPVRDLFAAFELHHIEDALALQILDHMGLSADVVLQGPHATPKKTGGSKPDTRKPARELNPSRMGGPGTDRRTKKPTKAKAAPAKKTAAKPPSSSLAKRHSTNTPVLIPMRTLDED